MTTEIKTRFEQMKRSFFDYSTTEKFITFLMDRAELIAPHRKGDVSFSYERVADPVDVVFNYSRTIQPLKKYFLPPRETLINFNTEHQTFDEPVTSDNPQIFFAIHSYEMQAMRLLDYSFERGNPESNYLDRRQNTIFIGISYTPDDWHFSKSVGIEIENLDCFSLFFEPVENGYLVFEVDDIGKDLVAEFGSGFTFDESINFEIKEKQFRTKIKYHHNRLPQIFEHVYDSPVWKEVAERCVGCGTCNLLCPTCYCFDVRDEVDLDIKTGRRERFWDGCMLTPFAEVAGDENFRPDLHSRTRHRLYRKFQYITQHSGELHCIGCGRCSKYCPADINIIEIINDLLDSVEPKK